MSAVNIFGTDSGGWYAFWSGFAQGVPLFGGLYLLARKHNCHVHRCWRIGRHPVDGTSYVTCRTHHPDGHKTAADINAEHRAALAKLSSEEIAATDADC
ncbi:MAG TPA: hypothetical protein VHE83_16300 [Mycobacteriales bacterium]|nr:hypothetical protein [Mycobacteriales bacterium]